MRQIGFFSVFAAPRPSSYFLHLICVSFQSPAACGAARGRRMWMSSCLRLRQRAPAAACHREREHVTSIHDEPAAPAAVHVLELDLRDALWEAPDAAARRAREALVDGQLPNPG